VLSRCPPHGFHSCSSSLETKIQDTVLLPVSRQPRQDREQQQRRGGAGPEGRDPWRRFPPEALETILAVLRTAESRHERNEKLKKSTHTKHKAQQAPCTADPGHNERVYYRVLYVSTVKVQTVFLFVYDSTSLAGRSL